MFIHLRENEVFLFFLCNLPAGCWWDTPRAILGLITFYCTIIHCIRQNGFDFGCLLFKFHVRWLFFGCSALGTSSWPERVTECALMFLLVFKLFCSAGWDLEINSFRMNFLNVFLGRGKSQVGCVGGEHRKRNLGVVADPENLSGEDGRILV